MADKMPWADRPKHVQEYVRLDAPHLADNRDLRWRSGVLFGYWGAFDESGNLVYHCEVAGFMAHRVRFGDLPANIRALADLHADTYQGAWWVRVEETRYLAIDKYSVLGDFRVPQQAKEDS